MDRKRDTSTDSIDVSVLQESGPTQTCETFEGAVSLAEQEITNGVEANIIVIAHPEGKRLGSRFRLRPGNALAVGRSNETEISLPEVLSLSRRHASLRHRGNEVTIQDLGSTNGTYVNGRAVPGVEKLKSGDIFQVASVHFKFLHERDVEHAYYEAIYQLVVRDGLTGIYNKRKFEDEMSKEFARSLRHRRPLALILVDLDHFKHINDGYGHLCGDFVLKELAQRGDEKLRTEQTFARIGGDEFVILSPETDAEGAETLAQKLCHVLKEPPVIYGETEVAVTCSCGVAVLTSDMKEPEALYEAADQALYAAKDAGRSQVVVYAPSSS